MGVRLQVCEFSMGDVEDPELYAAEPLWKWQQSEEGQWVMANAIETPNWHLAPDYNSYGHKVYVTADLREEDATFFKLKWQK
jgi:phage-related tail fiber protein